MRYGAIQSVFRANEYAPRKPRLSKQANLISLLKPGLLTIVRLLGEIRLVNLVVEPFQALDTSHELRF